MQINKMLKSTVLKTSFLDFHFVVHTTNHMVCGGYPRIITCVLIQNQYMAHVQYVVFLVRVFNINIRYNYHRHQVLHNINSQVINLSDIEHTGLWWIVFKTGKSFILNMRHLVMKQTKLIRLYQTESVIIWTYWCKLVNMVPLIQHIKLQWDNIY